MDAKQFAWLYLIENGTAGCRREYYGGWKIVDERAKTLKAPKNNPYGGYDYIKKDYLNSAKKNGVDWGKTAVPSNDRISVFNGTFCDDGSTEVISGTLVLCNGERQTWIADDIEIRNVFEMMAKAAEAEVRFKKLFVG